MDKNEPKSPSGADEAVGQLAPHGINLYTVDPAPLRAKIAEQEAELKALRSFGNRMLADCRKLLDKRKQQESELAALRARVEAAEAKAAKYDAINTPEIHDFLAAVEREALHQRDRWGSEDDAGKTDADWLWLIAYLASKAINKPEKALHHIITTAAACLNWHAQKVGAHAAMRPGISAERHAAIDALTQPKERSDAP